MTPNIEEVRAALEEVRTRFGTRAARGVIRDVGQAYWLADVPMHLYHAIIAKCRHLLDGSQITFDRLTSAASRLAEASVALTNMRILFMGAMDDLTGAVNNAVGEMGKAAQFIKDHPAAQNDPELSALASRLQTAADALAGVDVDAAAAGGGTADTGGGDTGTGGGGATA